MNHFLAVCFIVGLMYVLVAMTFVPFMPMCPGCGMRQNKHTDDCPWDRRDHGTTL